MLPQDPFELQASPRQERPQDSQSRKALEASAAHLENAARLLTSAAPDYRQVLLNSLQSIRQAYTALLEWHTRPPRPGASLAELSQPAEQLAGMLRIYRNRALPLEGVEASLRKGSPVTVEVREAVQTSYYVARDTLAVVLASLPEQITHTAVPMLDRAQAIRTGRFKPKTEAPLPHAAVRSAQAKPSSTPSVAVA